jgi:lambda repressor-like predicted transcriptional regulator
MDIATLTGTSETLAGLALKSGIARNTLRRRLAKPGQFNLDEIHAIANAADVDTFEVVARIAEWKQAAA